MPLITALIPMLITADFLYNDLCTNYIFNPVGFSPNRSVAVHRQAYPRRRTMVASRHTMMASPRRSAWWRFIHSLLF